MFLRRDRLDYLFFYHSIPPALDSMLKVLIIDEREGIVMMVLKTSI